MIPPQIIWELWSEAHDRAPKTTKWLAIVALVVIIGAIVTIVICADN